ncbi:MAG: hypothetical protein HY718_02230, partial [Planctomycetes bacterium]|nr:hypothetical protein [Planctomycetota bacterium]
MSRRLGRWFRPVIGGVLLGAGSAPAALAQGVDPMTLEGKLVAGYQGWFACPGDGSPASVGWHHWSKSRTDIGPGLYNVDLWPD